MRSSMAALCLVFGAVACDMNEGPREETREAEEAALKDKSPERVANEADDIHANDGTASTAPVTAASGSMEQARASLDAQITRHEAWLADVNREIEAGTRAANPDTKSTLSEIERNLKDARNDLGKMADQTGEDWRKTEADLRGELAQVEAAIHRIDSAGVPGETHP
jgi:hypothetical protein